MNLLRGATHTVRDAEDAAGRFVHWMDYRIVERGEAPQDLAHAWGAPASAGQPYVVCQPASRADVFIRFIVGDPVADYAPIRTFGWAAVELCVQDVLAANARMAESPFEVIGQPNRIPGLATIYPMQVRGPDLETVYLTEILTDAPDSGLPRAKAPIDKLFILVLACADMRASAAWFAKTLGVEFDAPTAIRYTMISKAFGLPIDSRHEIVTGRHGHVICLELDQYPEGAAVRPGPADALPPGVSICTLLHPDFDAVAPFFTQPPVARSGALYAGRRVGVLRAPEGALIEVVDGG